MVAKPRLVPLLAVGLDDLAAWQQALAASDAVYALTRAFPKEETYGLTSQMRRSIVSVASNIAEGEGRLTKGERRQALSNARGSLYEVRTQLVIAGRQGYCQTQSLAKQLMKLQRTLDGYIAFVRGGTPKRKTAEPAQPAQPT